MTNACGRGVEWPVEVAFQIVVRSARWTIEPVALAGSAFIHQNHVVVLGIAPLDRQSRQFRRRFTRTASHVEDRPLVRMWVTRRNEDDLQRQRAACSSLTVLEHIVETALQLLLYTLDVARRQRYLGRGGFRNREIEHCEHRTPYRGAS